MLLPKKCTKDDSRLKTHGCIPDVLASSLCAALGGTADPFDSAKCQMPYVQGRMGEEAMCYKSCAQMVGFVDDKGQSCYNPSTDYQTYNFSDQCRKNFNNWFSVCVDKNEGGICSGAATCESITTSNTCPPKTYDGCSWNSAAQYCQWDVSDKCQPACENRMTDLRIPLDDCATMCNL